MVVFWVLRGTSFDIYFEDQQKVAWTGVGGSSRRASKIEAKHLPLSNFSSRNFDITVQFQLPGEFFTT